MKEYWLFLDGKTQPSLIKEGWVLCRNIEDARECIRKRGMPANISFGCNLANDQHPGELIDWIVEQSFDFDIKIPKNMLWSVHAGSTEEKRLINGYMKAIMYYINGRAL